MAAWFHVLASRLRGLFSRRRWDDDFDSELDDHLSRLVDEQVRRGISVDAATRAARVRLGGLTQLKEAHRDQRSYPAIETLVRDMRYATRSLRRNPGFAAVAVLSLGLGIGANTAVFSVIDALILRTLPVADPTALVRFEWWSGPALSQATFAYPTFQEFRRRCQTLSAAAAVSATDRSNILISGPGGGHDPGQVRVALVSSTYFTTLGVNAIAGRTFVDGDDSLPGGNPIAVMSHGYWTRRLAEASDVVGRTLTFNETTYTIVGVTPPHFSGDEVGRPVDLWIPISMQSEVVRELPGLLNNPNRVWVRIVGRRTPGVTIDQVQAEITPIFQVVREPNRDPADNIRVAPNMTGVSFQREQLATPLVIVAMLVALVLLMACANVANLLLARSAAHAKEMALRAALGASRRRLLSQLLTESALLMPLAAGVGWLLAIWGTQMLATFASSGWMPMTLDLGPDRRVLVFTVLLSGATGLMFGLVPALRASRAYGAPTLKGEPGRRTLGFGPAKALVILQVALCMLLLMCAGLFVRSLRNLKSQDLGFDRDHVLLVHTAPEQSGRAGVALVDLFRTAPERIESLPGVASASATTGGLLTGGGNGSAVHVAGYVPKPHEDRMARWELVGPRFVETVGLRLQSGRDFTAADMSGGPRVGIVNEALARHYFGRADPIGQRFGIRGPASAGDVEIVGVVKDLRHDTMRDAGLNVVYLPYAQDPAHVRTMTVAVRTVGDQPGLADRIRNELRSLDPNLPILSVKVIDDELDRSLYLERLIASLSAFFGALAAFLACLGVYGVMSNSVARRVPEIGVRSALGATRFGVLALIVRESLVLVLAGIAIGLPLAVAAGHFLSERLPGLLFGLEATDAVTIGSATVMLAAVGLLAACLPAYRASRVDPMRALRNE